MNPCYLDNSATTKPFEEVTAAVASAMAHSWHNPSAAYGPAVAVEDSVRAARAMLLTQFGGQGSVVFTSGGTEADNLAILGCAGDRRARFITTAIEHPAVAQAFERLRALGHDVVVLPVDGRGIVSPEAITEAVDETTRLVSVMHVNNETGVIQELEALAAAARKKNPAVLFHSDGVQSFLKVPAQPARWSVDLYSVSAHKVHGPKGVGALYMGRNICLSPVQFGGGQEGGLRSGTENVPGIQGFNRAVEVYSAGLEARRSALMELKLALADRLLMIDGAAVNGPEPKDGAPHILNVSFDGIQGEVLLRALDEQGVYVSTGSACGARQRKPSPALLAMGLGQKRVESAIRFSLSVLNGREDVDRAAGAVEAQVRRLRTFKRR